MKTYLFNVKFCVDMSQQEADILADVLEAAVLSIVPDHYIDVSYEEY